MIIIDGHNLIGVMKNIKLSDPEAKNKLLYILDKYQSIIDRKIIVVFDRKIFGGYEFGKFKNIDIRYPIVNESADDVILRLIDKYQNQHGNTIVSSDNEIIMRANKAHLSCQTSQNFSKEIENTLMYDQSDTEKYLSPMEVDKWMDLFKKSKK